MSTNVIVRDICFSSDPKMVMVYFELPGGKTVGRAIYNTDATPERIEYERQKIVSDLNAQQAALDSLLDHYLYEIESRKPKGS